MGGSGGVKERSSEARESEYLTCHIRLENVYISLCHCGTAYGVNVKQIAGTLSDISADRDCKAL